MSKKTDEKKLAKQARDALKVAQNLISDESKWTQKAYARNKKGQVVGARNKEACSWCSLGALSVAAPMGSSAWIRASDYLDRAAARLSKKSVNVWEFNDSKRGHAKVMEMFSLARQFASSDI